ncbi:MAG: GIY-YIG nuclease family protein [Bacteroidales bacterium]|nr:GIY-YIG nuclease family protein [Bacteroidales bacterium]
MNKRNSFLIYTLLLAGFSLLLTNSCSKEDDSDITVRDIDGNVYHTVTVGTQTSKAFLLHNRSRKSFTASGKPWKLVYKEYYSTKKEALIREIQLKSWKNRVRIESLISKQVAGNDHPDLSVGMVNGSNQVKRSHERSE